MSNDAHNPADLLVISRSALEAYAQKAYELDARLRAAEARIAELQRQIAELQQEMVNMRGASHGENARTDSRT